MEGWEGLSPLEKIGETVVACASERSFLAGHGAKRAVAAARSDRTVRLIAS